MRRPRHPSIDAHAEQPQLRWPAERFYWSVLDMPSWSKPGVLPEGLRPLVADDVPLSHDDTTPQSDSLHAVCAPTGDGRLVICAAPLSTLAGLSTAASSLTPTALPDGIDAPADFDPAQLNLLVGELEPAATRRERRRSHLLAAAAVLLCAGLVTTGLARRAARWELVSDQAGAARDQVLMRLATVSSASDVTAELARLRRTSDALAHLKSPPDAAAALAGLLRAWPASAPCKPQSLAIAGGTASLSVLVEGDPAPFLESLKPPPGWILDEPRLNTAGAMTRLALSLRRESDATVPGGKP